MARGVGHAGIRHRPAAGAEDLSGGGGSPAPPAGVEGVSLKPLLREPAARWERPAFSVVQYRGHLGRAVTMDRWHYAEWDGGKGGAMLIDRVNDPHELKNLAGDAAHAATAAMMRTLLAKLPEK